MIRIALLMVSALLTLPAWPASGHEVRPGYLDLREIDRGEFAFTWKVPALGGYRLRIEPDFPDFCRLIGQVTTLQVDNSFVERGRMHCDHPIADGRITIRGLEAMQTDTLVRIETLTGVVETERLTPSQPGFAVRAGQGLFAVFQTYGRLGIEHILTGIDHLLFLMGLLLLIKDAWMLVKTITAFTIAHSITLTLATLGYANLPVPPLEAAIALSILFLGCEVVRSRRGDTSLTIRHPWTTAFTFGLLHGFGFASGLSEIGLPRNEIPLALVSFNLGVELGQLGFVSVLLLLERLFRALQFRWPRPIALLTAYVVGSLGAFWTLERAAAMLGSTS